MCWLYFEYFALCCGRWVETSILVDQACVGTVSGTLHTQGQLGGLGFG